MLRLRHMVVLFAVLMGLVGCGGATVAPPATLPPAAEIHLQLSWFHSLEFAGLYEAENQHYFADQNLKVTLGQGGFDSAGAYINPVQQVLDGTSQLGVAGTDVVLRARSGGAPIVAVAAIYQRSPVALLSLPASGITTPADLAGKTVGIAPPDTTVYISYRDLLNTQNINAQSVIEHPEDPINSVPDLLSGKIDVLHSFVTHEAIQAREQNPDVQVMLLSDYGIDIYSNVIFTSEQMIKDHPEQVQSLVTAVTKGLQWSVDNPEAAARHVVEAYGAGMAPPVVAEQQPGMMTAEVWTTTQQVLLEQQLIDPTLDVAAAYDLRFVDAAYASVK